MRFIADCMLGKLAKWLKILGFDTLFFSKIEDDELLAIAASEDRTLLTRDTGLIQKANDVESLFLDSDDWREQVRRVLQHFHLHEKVNPLSRCIDCNEALRNLPRKNAKNLVSPFVFERADFFSLCPLCGRVFWRGTHFDDMEAKIQDLLNKTPKK